MTDTPHDAALDGIRERLAQWEDKWDYIYQSCQPMVRDLRTLLDRLTRAEAERTALVEAARAYLQTGLSSKRRELAALAGIPEDEGAAGDYRAARGAMSDKPPATP